MAYERKIKKLGNSLGVYLPAEMLKEAGLKEGDTIYISLEDGDIIIRGEQQKKDDQKFKESVLAIIEEYMEQKDKEDKEDG